MVTFRLNKPMYGWKTLGPRQGSDLFLAQEVEDWLVDHNIKYDDYSERKTLHAGTSDEVTYLYFYLDIEDDDQAMLFKLSWM